MSSKSIVGMDKKQKSSLMIDKAIWKEIRLQAIREDKEIGELIESMFIEKYMQSQTQIQPQSRQPSSETQIIEINLPGIKFPAVKSKIIKLAEEANRSDKVEYVTHISDREYKNKSDLRTELLKDMKNNNI